MSFWPSTKQIDVAKLLFAITVCEQALLKLRRFVGYLLVILVKTALEPVHHIPCSIHANNVSIDLWNRVVIRTAIFANP